MTAGVKEYLQSEESSPEANQRDQRGRFLTGGKPGPGRPRGARSRLGEQFIQALADDFEENGQAVIKTVRARSPEIYLKVIKDTLPREVLVRAFSVSASVDLGEVERTRGRLAAFQYARRLVANDPDVGLDLDIDEGAVVAPGWRHNHDD